MPSDQELLALLNRRATGEHEPFPVQAGDEPAVAVEDPDRPSLIPYVKQDRVPAIMRGVDLILAATLRLQPDQLVMLGGQVSPWRRAGFFEVRTGPGEETVAGYAIIAVEPLHRDRVILVRERGHADERWAGVQVAQMMRDREDREDVEGRHAPGD